MWMEWQDVVVLIPNKKNVIKIACGNETITCGMNNETNMCGCYEKYRTRDYNRLHPPLACSATLDSAEDCKIPNRVRSLDRRYVNSKYFFISPLSSSSSSSPSSSWPSRPILVTNPSVVPRNRPAICEISNATPSRIVANWWRSCWIETVFSVLRTFSCNKQPTRSPTSDVGKTSQPIRSSVHTFACPFGWV